MRTPEQTITNQVAELCPELLNDEDTARLVSIGAQFIMEVTADHGSPDAPKWYAGSREDTCMLYHNGQSETASGHTSVGPDGAGVPRNVLVISNEVNEAARLRGRREIFSPRSQGRAFAAASGHDVAQLCGRSSIYGKDGDEELSAERVRRAVLEAGLPRADANHTAIDVRGTIFDPNTGAQAIDYGQPLESVLEQELTAGGDLFSSATERGVLGTVEWMGEELGLLAKGRILQSRMEAHDIQPTDLSTPREFFGFVDEDEILRGVAERSFSGQAGFHRSFRYSDRAIREACGYGIDELFPDRRQVTINKLERLGAAALNKTSFVTIWEDAHP